MVICQQCGEVNPTDTRMCLECGVLFPWRRRDEDARLRARDRAGVSVLSYRGGYPRRMFLRSP